MAGDRNLYVYVGGDPINETDPTGLQQVHACGESRWCGGLGSVSDGIKNAADPDSDASRVWVWGFKINWSAILIMSTLSLIEPSGWANLTLAGGLTTTRGVAANQCLASKYINFFNNNFI